MERVADIYLFNLVMTHFLGTVLIILYKRLAGFQSTFNSHSYRGIRFKSQPMTTTNVRIMLSIYWEGYFNILRISFAPYLNLYIEYKMANPRTLRSFFAADIFLRHKIYGSIKFYSYSLIACPIMSSYMLNIQHISRFRCRQNGINIAVLNSYVIKY